MTNETKHTPTPCNGEWVVIEDFTRPQFGRFIISTPRNEVHDGGREMACIDEMTGETREQTQERAAFIVDACNAHAAHRLVAECAERLRLWETKDDDFMEGMAQIAAEDGLAGEMQHNQLRNELWLALDELAKARGEA